MKPMSFEQVLEIVKGKPSLVDVRRDGRVA